MEIGHLNVDAEGPALPKAVALKPFGQGTLKNPFFFFSSMAPLNYILNIYSKLK